MGRRIQITETQLKYVIENIDRIVEQVQVDENLSKWLYSKLSDRAKKVWDNPKSFDADRNTATLFVQQIIDEVGERELKNHYWKYIDTNKNKEIFFRDVNKVPIPQPKTTPLKPFVLNINFDKFKPFEDNMSDPTPELIEYITNALKSRGYDSGTKFVKFGVESSASRLRNTLEPNITWEELSKQRASKTAAKIQEIFSGAGLKLPKPQIVAKGGQGEDPYKNGKIVTGAESKGTDELKPEYYPQESCSGSNIEGCGSKRHELDKYKYLKIWIVPEEKVEPEKPTDYFIRFRLDPRSEYKPKTKPPEPPRIKTGNYIVDFDKCHFTGEARKQKGGKALGSGMLAR